MNTTKCRMLLIGFTAFILAVPLSGILAQPNPEAQAKRIDELVSFLKEKLTLSEEQTTQTTEIVTKSFERLSAVREQYRGEREAMMEAMRENNEAMYTAIGEILTEEQKAVYDKVKEELREKNRDRFRERRGNR